MPASAVVDYFVGVTTRDSARARQELKFESGLRYGDKDSNTVDVFGTDLPDRSPILVFFSGGYWQVCSCVCCYFNYFPHIINRCLSNHFKNSNDSVGRWFVDSFGIHGPSTVNPWLWNERNKYIMCHRGIRVTLILKYVLYSTLYIHFYSFWTSIGTVPVLIVRYMGLYANISWNGKIK